MREKCLGIIFDQGKMLMRTLIGVCSLTYQKVRLRNNAKTHPSNSAKFDWGGKFSFDRGFLPEVVILNFSPQYNIAMTLDNIFQAKIVNQFQGFDHLVAVAINDIRDRHKNIPGKQDPIFLDQHADSILAVAW